MDALNAYTDSHAALVDAYRDDKQDALQRLWAAEEALRAEQAERARLAEQVARLEEALAAERAYNNRLTAGIDAADRLLYHLRLHAPVKPNSEAERILADLGRALSRRLPVEQLRALGREV